MTETSSGITLGSGLYWCEDFTYQVDSRTGPWSVTNAAAGVEAWMEWDDE